MNDALLKDYLRQMADKYETKTFLDNDPSGFMHVYSNPVDQEIVAITAASLSFGQRTQICAHIKTICNAMIPNPQQWVLEKRYQELFPENPNKFYRFISYADLRHFFDKIRQTINTYGSLGNYAKLSYQKGIDPVQAIINLFQEADTGYLIPLNKKSYCKRIHMFLRWMVRQNSPVDLGLWNWYDPSYLLIPVDTHVLQESLRLGLIKKQQGSKIVETITNAMREIWPKDPCRGDFALFGTGVNA
jgi:uncharacterized protein (TIGR02757 family)